MHARVYLERRFARHSQHRALLDLHNAGLHCIDLGSISSRQLDQRKLFFALPFLKFFDR